ncbi:MAG: tripartite tricarboxylate transporter TctB family protein [Syntrophales bacterium]
MNPRKEIASSLVLILFSTTFLLYTTRYPLDDWESPGPAVFPLILGAILLALASGQLIQALLEPKRPGRARESLHGVGAVQRFLRENGGEAKVITLTVMLVLYILMMKWIGFFVSTFLLVVLTSRLVEAKDWVRPIALAAGVCLFCYLLFEVWIKLSFPRGILF